MKFEKKNTEWRFMNRKILLKVISGLSNRRLIIILSMI